MSIVEELRQQPQRVLDRLVDGELSPADRRAVLAAMDDEPGAWRACALAFLESQIWQSHLNQFVQSRDVVPTAGTVTTSARSWSLPRLGGWLAVAAGLVISFVLGANYTSGPASRELAGEARPGAKLENTVPVARGTRSTLPAVANPPSSVPVTTVAQNPEPESGWSTLTLTAADGETWGNQQIELRVRNTDSTDPSTLMAEGSTLPADLLDTLEAAGWQVERQQRLLPIDLSDGRRLVVPVEELNLRNPDWVQF